MPKEAAVPTQLAGCWWLLCFDCTAVVRVVFDCTAVVRVVRIVLYGTPRARGRACLGEITPSAMKGLSLVLLSTPDACARLLV